MWNREAIRKAVGLVSRRDAMCVDCVDLTRAAFALVNKIAEVSALARRHKGCTSAQAQFCVKPLVGVTKAK